MKNYILHNFVFFTVVLLLSCNFNGGKKKIAFNSLEYAESATTPYFSHTGKYAGFVDNQIEYAGYTSVKLSDVTYDKSPKKIKISAYLYYKSPNTKASVVFSIRNKKTQLLYDLKEEANKYITNKWQYIEREYEYKEDYSANDVLIETYLWRVNQLSDLVFIDDVKIELLF